MYDSSSPERDLQIIAELLNQLNATRASLDADSTAAKTLDDQMSRLMETMQKMGAQMSSMNGTSGSTAMPRLGAGEKLYMLPSGPVIANDSNVIKLPAQTPIQMPAGQMSRQLMLGPGTTATTGLNSNDTGNTAANVAGGVAADEAILQQQYQMQVAAAYEAYQTKFAKIMKDSVQSQANSTFNAEAAQAKFNSMSTFIPGGQSTLDEVSTRASNAGFSSDNLKSASTDAGSGVTSLSYQMTTAEGVARNFNVTIDKAGNIAENSGRRFQSFGEDIARDTLEFVKWSVSMTLVMAPLAEITKLAQQTAQSQDSLVNTTIALGTAQKSLNEVYTNAYQISQNVSEETGKIVDAFTLAYRATGSVSNGTDRFTVATKLLTDSMTLAKLSGMDESTAIDTLTASLRQENMSLDDGNQLLDVWVQATKIANIDLNSLATSFAMAGDVANAANMSIDELTGLVATLGEVSTGSADQIATMSKTVISGFQSSKGEVAMKEFGISLEDAAGNARDFMDVLNQVAAMKSTGLLNDTQYSELTLALGGGRRQQALWSTLIENTGRINEVSNGVSGENSAGAAADALALKQETVVSATTRMTNAMSNLGMTLGTKGGLLDDATALLNVFTGLIDVIDKISGATGKVTPLLIALGAMAALNSTKTGANMISGVVNKVAASGPNQFLNNIFGTGQSSDVKDYSVNGTKATTPTLSPIIPYALSAALIGMTAMSDFKDTSLNKYQQTEKGTADIAGGIAGMIVGSMLGAGPLIGSTIGMAISNAFVSATVAADVDWNAMFTKPGIKSETGSTINSNETDAQKQADIINSIQKTEGGVGGALGGGLRAWAQTSLYNATGLAVGDLKGMIGKLGYTPDNVSMSQYYGMVATPQQTKDMTALQDKMNPTTSYTNNPTLVAIENQVYSTFKGSLTKLSSDIAGGLLTQEINGTITNAAYNAALKNTGNFNTTVTAAYGTIGQSYQTLTGEDAQKTLEDFANVYTNSSTEEQAAIADLIQQIATEKDALTGLTSGSKAYKDAQDTLSGTVTEATGLMKLYNDALAQQVKLTPTVNAKTVANQADYDKVVTLAKQLQYSNYVNTGGNPADYNSWATQFKEVPQLAGEYGKPVSGVSSTFLDEALSELQQQDKIGTVSSTGLGITDTNATLAQYEQATSKYADTLKQFEAIGYKPNITDTIVTTTDAPAFTEHKDMKIVQMLLSQILDVNQKQLDTGLYNFPSGMSANVPFGVINANLAQQGSGSPVGITAGTIPGVSSTLPTVETSNSNVPFTEVVAQSSPIIAAITAQAAHQFKANANDFAQASANQTAINKFREADLTSMKSYNAYKPAILPNDFTPYSGLSNLGPDLLNFFENLFNPSKGGLGTASSMNLDNTKTAMDTKLNIDVKGTTNIYLDVNKIASAVSSAIASSVVKMSNAGSTSVRVNYI
jgi:TP901 family phage tail tape measure protein